MMRSSDETQGVNQPISSTSGSKKWSDYVFWLRSFAQINTIPVFVLCFFKVFLSRTPSWSPADHQYWFPLVHHRWWIRDLLNHTMNRFLDQLEHTDPTKTYLHVRNHRNKTVIGDTIYTFHRVSDFIHFDCYYCFWVLSLSWYTSYTYTVHNRYIYTHIYI